MRRLSQLLFTVTLFVLAACSSSANTNGSSSSSQPHVPQILAIGDSLTGGYFASDQAHDYMSLLTTILHAQAIDTHGTYGVSALRTLPGLLSSPPPTADIMIVELGTMMEVVAVILKQQANLQTHIHKF